MQLGNPEIIMLPTVRPPLLSLSTVACRSVSCQGICGPPISTLLTPSCLTLRICSSLIGPPSGAQSLGVLGPSCGIPGPCGPLYSPSAAAAGNTAAADNAAVEQIPFISVRLEKSVVILSPLDRHASTLLQAYNDHGTLEEMQRGQSRT